MQAVAVAGGFRRTAAQRAVVILRLSEDGYLRALVVPAAIDGQPGPYMALRTAVLQADDVVFVPESGRSQVTRIIDDFINRPLAGVNSLFFTYVNFKLIQELQR
jgi:protein involved in polysaccharide export with SLBB domain